MAKRAKPFWVNETKVTKQPATNTQPDITNISSICTGASDDCWKFGSD